MRGTEIARSLVAALLLVGLVSPSPPQTQGGASTKQTASATQYRNATYGFCVSLPASWKGYAIVSDHWDGFNNNGPQGYQVVEHGPLVLIRHPLWSKENPRQDIPIMVFTGSQWAALEKDEFHIGAAPIGPSQLGRNRKYVFALPARYNFTDLTGVEEVDQIVRSKSLHAPCAAKTKM